jgi:hypothetical protein
MAKQRFFPFFSNLAEKSRLVRIAERYRELGGWAIFFSHGGEYESFPSARCRMACRRFVEYSLGGDTQMPGRAAPP